MYSSSCRLSHLRRPSIPRHHSHTMPIVLAGSSEACSSHPFCLGKIDMTIYDVVNTFYPESSSGRVLRASSQPLSLLSSHTNYFIKASPYKTVSSYYIRLRNKLSQLQSNCGTKDTGLLVTPAVSLSSVGTYLVHPQATTVPCEESCPLGGP